MTEISILEYLNEFWLMSLSHDSVHVFIGPAKWHLAGT